jgi:hypothetical protein
MNVRQWIVSLNQATHWYHIVHKCLQSAVVSMRNMAQNASNFRQSIVILKQQGFQIGHTGTQEYKPCMQMLKIAFPNSQRKPLLNHISAKRKTLNPKMSMQKSRVSLMCAVPPTARKDNLHADENIIAISNREEEEDEEEENEEDEEEGQEEDEEEAAAAEKEVT